MKHILAIAALGLIATTPAHGETVNLPCAEYGGVKDHLASKWKEYPVIGGITGEGAGLVEVFASADGDTFTIVVHGPDGKACVIAAGTNWGEVHPQNGEPL